MIRRMSWVLGASLVVLFSRSLWAATPTFIEADGKRLLHFFPELSGDLELTSDVTNKTALWIGKNEILNGADRKTVLVVDDADVRHTSNGLVLASFDANEEMVHGRRGKTIIYYHHPDICPKFGGKTMYIVNGPQLSKTQLVAVLYSLKPELFTLTDEEKAAQQKEIAANAAEADRLAKLDPIPRKWQVLNGHGPVEHTGAGDITFAPRKGDAYPVTYDYSADGGPKWAGVAVVKMINNDPVVFAAYGTPKTVGLCVYEIKGGTLSGKWYPWYIDGDAKNVGTEELKGPESLDGEFAIVSAKAPSTGAAYTGTVTIKPQEIVGAGDKEQPYLVTWTFGTTKVEGFGIRTGDFLFVSSGAGPDVNIAKYKLENGGATFHGDWFKLGSKEMGGTAAMN